MRENETVEFKKTLGQIKEGIISIAAILNKHGEGELWFGIRDDGVPVGVNVGVKTIRDISQAIAAHIEPKIYPEITTERIAETQCIRVRFAGLEAPYAAYGRQYVRVGDEDRQMSGKELERFFSKKNRSAAHWDSEPCKTNVSDLDEKRVQTFVEHAGLPWHSMLTALENLDLLTDGRLKNAAPLFFSTKPPLKLRCAVFGTETTSFIIDRQDFDGDLLELIEEAQKYILKNIHIGMRLEGLYRVDVPEIAVPALREAIINAFCHRDYRDSEYVQVAVFKNRVEIRNPGTLFGGITIESLRRGKLSRRRNPLIAQMLTRIHMMEAWGRGMTLILENEPDVQFEELAGMFIASFVRPSLDMGAQPGVASLPEAQGVFPTTPVEQPVKTPGERPGERPTKTWERIIHLLQKRPDITMSEVATLLSLNPRTVERHFTALQKNGHIRRVGPNKGGTWEVVN